MENKSLARLKENKWVTIFLLLKIYDKMLPSQFEKVFKQVD